MIYLSGAPHRSLVGIKNLGFCLTPQMGNKPDYLHLAPWAADTGCFNNPDAFDPIKYLAWLAQFPAETLLFATAPDRLGDWRETTSVALPVLSDLNALGIMSAYVAQDGLTPGKTPWSCFGCLFLGGRDRWKESREAGALAKEAKRQEKWLHMGRVNSKRRMQIARDFGCDSVDGTYLAHGRDKLRKNVEWWLKWVNDQEQFSF